jgi:hypothetical protein
MSIRTKNPQAILLNIDKDVVTMPIQELGKLTQAIRRVRELHTINDHSDSCNDLCDLCMTSWPCDTIRALDGESDE